ncbi:MAG: hypothetical protein FVQ79_14110, partial [Planctomycetes bacterium]|nr:hypothetical protein [Planctomycetota bacterium]
MSIFNISLMVMVGDHDGNMDARVIREGSRVYFQVRQKGAMFGLGVSHADMGDKFASIDHGPTLDEAASVALNDMMDLIQYKLLLNGTAPRSQEAALCPRTTPCVSSLGLTVAARLWHRNLAS